MLLVMRRLRRLSALVTSVLMVRLVVASSAMACPMGDDATDAARVVRSDDAESAIAAAHQSKPMSGHHEGAPASSHHHMPTGSHCATPCPAAACAALGHCGPASLRDDEARRVADDVAASTIIVERASALHSVSTAPEPPPPRA